jgi:hypothetical protein
MAILERSMNRGEDPSNVKIVAASPKRRIFSESADVSSGPVDDLVTRQKLRRVLRDEPESVRKDSFETGSRTI